MPSLHKTAATGKPLPICLASLLFLHVYLSSSCSGVQGASLREHRLRGSEADIYQAPNADMLKALRYIEDLRQRTGMDSQQHGAFAAGYNARHTDDSEKLQAMLRLVSNPAQSGEEREAEEEGREDKSEELLRAVLSTLQHAEEASRPASSHPSMQQKQHGIRAHRKLPLMFEDDEEGEGDEDEEGSDLEHESPFKRTNENVEEKYTPQNLATLQSVFDELDKLTSFKPMHKRQDEEEDEEDEEDEGEDDDVFNVRNVDLADWGPLQEQEEETEEKEEGEREDKHEVNRGLDYVDDDDDDDDVDDDEEEENDESYPVKRSKDPDDVANLVDYYLLKVLEKTEEEEQKREIEEEEEEEEEEERRAAHMQYSENIDPRAIYQLIQISQKYQIPPEDLVDIFKTGANREKVQKNELFRAGSKRPLMSSKKTHTSRHPKTPEELRTDEILNILGLGGVGDHGPARKQYKSPPSPLHSLPAGRPGESAPTQTQQRRPPPPPPSSLKGQYDDSVDEDELAAYLAAQMLAQYQNPTYRNNKKQSQKREEAGQSAAGSSEPDYFTQVDFDKSSDEKRHAGGEETAAFDNEELMSLLSFLNPEKEESEANTGRGV